MASSIIHRLRLFAVHPSSDPAAKKIRIRRGEKLSVCRPNKSQTVKMSLSFCQDGLFWPGAAFSRGS